MSETLFKEGHYRVVGPLDPPTIGIEMSLEHHHLVLKCYQKLVGEGA